MLRSLCGVSIYGGGGITFVVCGSQSGSYHTLRTFPVAASTSNRADFNREVVRHLVKSMNYPITTIMTIFMLLIKDRIVLLDLG